MKEFIEYVVKQLVDKPDDFRVTVVRGERVTVYELLVGDGDTGKVIGKRGQTAFAIRKLLSAAAAKKKGTRSILEIIE